MLKLSNPQLVLFNLLRKSLGTDSSESLPDVIDWNGVIDLSFDQGVAALAVDGLQRSLELKGESLESGEFELDKPELEDVKYEWFGENMAVEQDYANISATVDTLSKHLKESGIKALLVKGLSYASYYPIPQHRAFGDIDIFSPTSQKAIDDALKLVSDNYSFEYYRHSKCSVNGIKIENHNHLCDVRGQKRWLPLEKAFSTFALETLNAKTEGGLYFSDNRLSVLFYLYHAQAHFIAESISLRFLTDWAVMLNKERELISSGWFKESVEKFGLKKITGVLTSLCIKHLGTDRSLLPESLLCLVDGTDESLERKVLDDIFRKEKEGFGNSSLVSRMKRAVVMFKRGWKYREFLGVCPLPFVLEKWVGIMKESLKK